MLPFLQEGVRREVMEETGLEFQPRSVICVEVQIHRYTVWVRFTVIGAWWSPYKHRQCQQPRPMALACPSHLPVQGRSLAVRSRHQRGLTGNPYRQDGTHLTWPSCRGKSP